DGIHGWTTRIGGCDGYNRCPVDHFDASRNAEVFNRQYGNFWVWNGFHHIPQFCGLMVVGTKGYRGCHYHVTPGYCRASTCISVRICPRCSEKLPDRSPPHAPGTSGSVRVACSMMGSMRRSKDS